MSGSQTPQPNHTDAFMQFLIFSIAHEDYALNLTEIKEIVDVPTITPVPNMPVAVRGVSNLRGRIVTIIDTKVLFDIQDEEKSEQQHLIVAERDNELFGLLVDEAEEVLRTTADALQNTPELLQAHPHAAYLSGVIVQTQDHQLKQQSTQSTEELSSQERIILSLNLQAILQEFNAVSAQDAPQTKKQNVASTTTSPQS